jgi:hypothetical protein
VRLVSAVAVSATLTGAGLAFGIAAAATPSVPIHVTPSSGGARTVFVIDFRAPDTTGVNGTLHRFYVLNASAPSSAVVGGCLAGIDIRVLAARKGSRVRVRLDAGKLGGRWCVGVYRGAINELESPVCPHGLACPTYVRLLGTVGRFALEVRATPSHEITTTTTTTTPTTTSTPPGNGTPPSFGGLQNAFACTPGPQRPGETTPFTLSWQAAADAVTPTSQIVYDVYLASTPGGESFSTPTWTTDPGVTTYKTPGLPSHGSFYFVVRARDSAGNEDRNTTEVHGSDPCV